MAEERKQLYGDRPIPEGATISRTGRVWKKTQEVIPCPLCTEGWMDTRSTGCHACWRPDPAHMRSSLPKARAARKAKCEAARVAKTHAAKRRTGQEPPLQEITVLGLEVRPIPPAKLAGEAAPDLINHPPHYEAGGFEALPIVRALGFDFEEGSAFKYLFRHKRKGAPLEDLKKCRFFVDSLIARYEGEQVTP